MTTEPTGAAYERLHLGTAPDSWGVWFDDDPHQVGWRTYLDEIVTAGYVLTELGPYGFLPIDPAPLGDELGSRGSPSPAARSSPGCTAAGRPSSRRSRTAVPSAGC